MSSTVDNRVVQMKFDNKDFESNVGTSLKTLKTLNENLKMTDGTSGFNNLAKAAKGVTLDTLASSVESIQSRFSTLGVIGMTALQNITNSAIETGKQMLASLTIDPIKDGFGEYELKMGSVQTIMSSTGAELSEVNGYLGELNEYADKTIYSFSDMTSSIGKFTNNGVKLDKAVQAIKGISNEAALSGANAEQASHAMYNFAQALSSGSVKLIDWKSIENANMATVEFKQELIDTALKLGTVVKEGDKYRSTTTDLKGHVSELFDATSMFNDSLSAQWMTSDVLVETLGRYSDETTDLGQRATAAATEVKTFTQLMDTLKEAVGSGWAETFELIFGDFEQAKKLWTAVNDKVGAVLDAQAKARNDLLKDWQKFGEGGRNVLGDALNNTWEALLAVIVPVKEAFRDIFPPMTAKRLYELTVGLRDLTAKMIIGTDTADRLKRIFRGVFAVFDIFKQLIGLVIKAISPFAPALGGASGGILEFLARIGDLIYSLDQALKGENKFTAAFQRLHDVITLVITRLTELFTKLKAKIREFGGLNIKPPDTSALPSFSAVVSKAFAPFINMMEALKKASPLFAKIGSIIVDTMKKIGHGLQEVFTGKGFDSLMSLFNGGVMAAIGVMLVKFIKNLDTVTDSIKGIFDGFGGIGEGIKSTLEAATNAFGAFTASMKANALKKIAIAIAILTASLVALSMLDPDRLGGALGGITVLFAELSGLMLLMQKSSMNLKSAKAMIAAESALMKMSTAVLLLSIALKQIGEIEPDRLKGALLTITALIGELTAVTIVLSKWGGKIKTGALSLIIFAEAVKILASAVLLFKDLNTEQLRNGLIGVGVVLAELAAFMAASNFSKFGVFKATAVVELAAGLLVLQKAVAAFGEMDIDAIVHGLTTMGVVLAEVAAFSLVAGKANNILSTATSLTIIGGAMLIFAEAIKQIGSLRPDQIVKGLVGIAGSLGGVAIAVQLMPKNMIAIGLGLLEISAALLVISKVFTNLGGLSWPEIAKGMVAIAGSLTIFAVALRFMQGTTAAAASVLIISAALATLTPVLLVLGSMSLAEIGMALLALAGAFTVLGVAGKLLGPLVPSMIGLSAALAILGAAVALVGVGLLAFATGLASLAVSGVAGVTALVSILNILIVGILDVIRNSAKALAEAVKAVILALVDVFVECTPAIVDGVLKVVEEILRALAEHAPAIVTYLFDFLIGVINALAEKLPELIKAAVNFIGAFFRGIVDAVKGIDSKALLETILAVGFLAALMAALNAIVALIPGAMLGVLGIGAVLAEITAVLAAVGALNQINGFAYLVEEGGKLLETVGRSLGQFIGGIVGGIAEGATKSLPQIGQNLTDFMENLKGFIEIASTIQPGSMESVGALGKAILTLTAADILDGLTRWFRGDGGFAEFGKELEAFAPSFRSFAEQIKGVDSETVTASANAAMSLAEMANNLPNNGGLAGKIFGENRLSDFGEELKAFGPVFAEYATSVSGINPEAVSASATAAQALAEMANNLPNNGGLASKLFGENKLSEFGEELKAFAPSFAEYAAAISGISPEVVIASANAAKALAEMASDLPNSGGLIGFITGDNNIDDFGTRLKSFGKSFAEYANSITGVVQPGVVEASASAAKALAELEASLPKTGGVVGFFTGNKDFSQFGAGLVSFGSSLAAYYKSIIVIKADTLSRVTSEVSKLVYLMKTVTELDVDKIKSFSKALESLAKNAIDKFVKAFSGSEKKVKSTVTAFVTAAKKAISDKQKELGDEAKKAGEKVIGELEKKLKETRKVTDAAKALCDAVINAIKTKLSSNEIYNAGASVASKLAEGIYSSNSSTTVYNAGARLANSAYEGVKSYTSSFTNAGQWLLSGLVSGLYDRNWVTNVQNAGTYIGQTLLASLNASLGISSPSKEGEKVGKYVNAGIVKGLGETTEDVAKESSLVGDTVTTSLENSIDLDEITNNLERSGVNWKKYRNKVWRTLGVSLKGLADDIVYNLTRIDDAEKDSSFTLQDYLMSEYDLQADDAITAIESVKKSLNSASGAVKNVEKTIVKGLDKTTDQAAKKSTTLGDTIETNLDKSFEQVDDSVTVLLSKISDQLAKIVELIEQTFKPGTFYDSGVNVTEDVASGMTGNQSAGIFSEASTKFSDKLKDTLKAQIRNDSSEYESIGKMVSNSLTNSMNNDGSLKKIKTSISQAAAEHIKQLKNDKIYSASKKAASYGIGKSVIEGVSKGVKDHLGKLEHSGRKAGLSTLKGLKSSLKINSPSKEGEEIGKFVDLGVSDGLIGFIGNVVKTAKSVGNTLTNTLSRTLSGIDNVIGDDYISDPVIRPVVDLSNVTASANQIDGMFGTQRTVNLAGSVTESMNRSSHSLQNDLNEVSSAVSKLQDAVNKLRDEHGDITNYFNISQTPGESMEDFAKYVAQYITREYNNQREVWGTA